MKIKERVMQLMHDSEKITIQENFSQFSIDVTASSKPSDDIELIQNIIELIDENDKFTLSYRIDNNEAVTLENRANIEDFSNRIKDEFQYYELGESVTIKLYIFKSSSSDT